MERRQFFGMLAAPLALFFPFDQRPQRERVIQRFGTDGRLHRVEFEDLRPGDLFVSLDLPLDESSFDRGDVIYRAKSFPKGGSIDVRQEKFLHPAVDGLCRGLLTPQEARAMLGLDPPSE